MPECSLKLGSTTAEGSAVQVLGERKRWDAVWIKAEELIREGILVSPNMATDHYAMTLQVTSSTPLI